jgi:hypothetical protein
MLEGTSSPRSCGEKIRGSNMRPLFVSVLLLILTQACSARMFPDWKAAPLGLSGTWERAEAMVIAELRNAVAAGDQEVRNLPWPAASTIRRIYWCVGELVVHSAIRGSIPSKSKRYLRGAIRPGCQLKRTFYGHAPDRESVTQLWFIREETHHIRLVVDARGRFFSRLAELGL